MSLYWSETAITQTASICITSTPALIDALEQMGCNIHTTLPASRTVSKAQENYENCLTRLESAAPMSLERATEFQQIIEDTIQASSQLANSIEKANNETPSKIEFTDSSGVSRTLNRKAGAYILEWTDIERSSNQGHKVTKADTASHNFSSQLIETSEKTQVKRKADEQRAMSSIESRDAKLREQLTKAIAIREKWQTIEDSKRVENLRQERASEIEARGSKMGFRCKRVVNNKDEIVISMRRRV